jgi:hypothetical protein
MSYGQDMRVHNDVNQMAVRLGLVPVHPEPDELQLDIDDRDDMRVAVDMLAVLEGNGVPARVIKTTRSKSGNAHVYIKLEWPEGLDPVTRIALQACLGSDRKRELLSLLRHLFQTQHPPTVLFEVSA